MIAQESISDSNWKVGETAAAWNAKFARGRTDADFGELVGISGEQVAQRRITWEKFHACRFQFGDLRWSHFYAATTWEIQQAVRALAWANDMGATVAEMNAWVRAENGEDLSEPESH